MYSVPNIATVESNIVRLDSWEQVNSRKSLQTSSRKNSRMHTVVKTGPRKVGFQGNESILPKTGYSSPSFPKPLHFLPAQMVK